MLHNFEKIYLGSSVSYAHEHLSTWSQIFESPALDSKMLCGRWSLSARSKALIPIPISSAFSYATLGWSDGCRSALGPSPIRAVLHPSWRTRQSLVERFRIFAIIEFIGSVAAWAVGYLCRHLKPANCKRVEIPSCWLRRNISHTTRTSCTSCGLFQLKCVSWLIASRLRSRSGCLNSPHSFVWEYTHWLWHGIAAAGKWKINCVNIDTSRSGESCTAAERVIKALHAAKMTR